MTTKLPINYLLLAIVLATLVLYSGQSKQQQTVSIGTLTTTLKKEDSDDLVNEHITLTPMIYSKHLPNLDMMKVRIVKAKPFDACTTLDSMWFYPIQDDFEYPDTFALVDGQSGTCSYWRKSQMAKEAWVRGIIIIDDDHAKNTVQDYDVSSEGQSFFSFLIQPEDAKKLLNNNEGKILAQGSISIRQNDQEIKPKTQIYLWLSSLNEQSYNYLEWWNQTMINLPQLADVVEWQPKYVFYGQSFDSTQKQVYSCACKGLFCSPQYHGKTTDVLIKEDIRQKLIYEKYSPEVFMRYIGLFQERCLGAYIQNRYAEDCAATQMIKAGVNDSEINSQVERFLYECDKDAGLFGQLLADKGRFSLIGTYPTMLINRQIVEFKSQEDLQAMFCRKFSLEGSDSCIMNYKTTISQIVVSIVFFLLILFGLFGVGFAVVTCYKNRLRKEMNKEVKMQVSTAVEHYYQLSEDSGVSGK